MTSQVDGFQYVRCVDKNYVVFMEDHQTAGASESGQLRLRPTKFEVFPETLLKCGDLRSSYRGIDLVVSRRREYMRRTHAFAKDVGVLTVPEETGQLACAANA